ncbi:MAG: hypothetical protein WCZ89_08055, partial [Phycisphaerae bacterium]
MLLLRLTSIIFFLASASIIADATESITFDLLYSKKGPENIFGQSGNAKEAYVVYAETMSGNDWGERINNAIDKLLEDWPGGEVILPVGQISVSTTIDFSGTGTMKDSGASVILRGPGGPRSTELIWKGLPNKPVIEMASPWFCQIRNLAIDGNKTKGVIGIRFRAGWERGTAGKNTARHNVVDGVYITNCDIGFQIGDYYGPDLASHNFRDIWINKCRLGINVLGANVANLWFTGITITGGEDCEAGFKLENSGGFIARSITEKSTKPPPRALRDTFGKEVFFEEVPIGARKFHSFGETAPGTVSGGIPEFVVYGLSVAMHNPKGWVIHTDCAPIRIYSARTEGVTPLLYYSDRSISDLPFNVMLQDVASYSLGNEKGNVIEYHGPGPLYLINCSLLGNVACGDTDVFSIGTHFWFNKHVEKKVELLRGGFVPISPANKPQIHQAQNFFQLTVEVPKNAKLVKVPLTGINNQR